MIVKKELMKLAEAECNPNRSQYKGSCCALVAHTGFGLIHFEVTFGATHWLM
jgi:hypothetical protein